MCRSKFVSTKTYQEMSARGYALHSVCPQLSFFLFLSSFELHPRDSASPHVRTHSRRSLTFLLTISGAGVRFFQRVCGLGIVLYRIHQTSCQPAAVEWSPSEPRGAGWAGRERTLCRIALRNQEASCEQTNGGIAMGDGGAENG